MLLIIVINNIYAIRVVRNQVYESNRKILSIYMNQIDQSFDDIEKYLVGLQISENLIIIETTDSEVDYFTAQARMLKEIDSAIPSYRFIDSIFFFFSREDLFIDSVKFHVNGREQNLIRQMIRTYIDDNEEDLDSRGKWISLDNGDGFYLVRILKVKDVYMGSCARVSNILETLLASGDGEIDSLTLYNRDGFELGNTAPDGIEIDLGQDSFQIVGDKKKYIFLNAPSRKGDYNLASFLQDSAILEGLDSIQRMILYFSIFIVIFLYGFFSIVEYWLLRPLSNLVQAMRSLGEGNLDIRLNERKTFEEFQLLNETFDQMIVQIKNLRIDIYEERHLRQNSELQYLKLQMNPHYYINCLNTIYNLSIVGKDDLIQKMTTFLGEQLRYTMEGNSLGPLRKEIVYVENFLEIQNLRYSECLVSHFEVEPDAMDILVPPLIIQTFVENTVKYQIEVDGIVELWIRIEIDGNNLCIQIWDSGEGFSEDVLRKIIDRERIFDERGEHYGIYNVCQRLKLIFADEADISFSNHELTGGACIRISIPIRREREE